MGDINTGGGAFVDGDASGGRGFAGRDSHRGAQNVSVGVPGLGSDSDGARLRRIEANQNDSQNQFARIEEKLYGIEGDRQFSFVGRLGKLEEQIAGLRRQLYITGILVGVLVVLLFLDFFSRFIGG